LVLTLIGNDRPGLVEDLARAVSEHGGSWESGRMARLAGCFAGILEVQVPNDRAAELFKVLHGLEGRGLRLVVEDSTGSPRAEEFRALRLELVGQDRPGIIHEISATLASSGVNVVELSTRTSPAPMSGEKLFSASALLHHPLSESVVALRENIEKLAEDLMVEITVSDA
jgi:glycine cleavage system regulatory protein